MSLKRNFSISLTLEQKEQITINEKITGIWIGIKTQIICKKKVLGDLQIIYLPSKIL